MAITKNGRCFTGKHYIYQYVNNILLLQIGAAVGKLNTFIVEPFLPHDQVTKGTVIGLLE